MDIISLAVLAMNSIRTVLANPLLGGGSSVKMNEASELLGVFAALLEQGDDAYDDLKAFTETVQAMAEEGRAPSRAEWDILKGRSDDAHDRLQAVKEELLGEQEEENETPTEPPATTEAEETGEGEGDDDTVTPV